jgi:cellulose synthase/poly-beta-1,6-N-acetylglucosamine synthase-like glycosyltransferase
MLFSVYFFCISTGISYILLIRQYLNHWRLIPTATIPEKADNFPFVSIIVPARNEEKHISKCLLSIIQQDYPTEKFEIIVVDDYSTDHTVAITKSLQSQCKKLSCISLHENPVNSEIISYKREAIKIGIAQSTSTIILLTDADCEVPPNWIKLMANPFIDEECVFVGGPVVITHMHPSLLTHFQALDMIGMMIITGAGYHSGNQLLANGANMAFSKKAFYETGAYTYFPEKASGDDIFLLHQLNKAYPGKIKFIKSLEGAVKTQPVLSVASFLSQRLRWASKNREYQELNIKISLLLILLLSTLTLGFGILSCFNFRLYFPLFLLLFSSKFIGDYLLQKEAINFFKEYRLMKYLFISQILHTFYIMSVGMIGIIKIRYAWKGRMVK